MQLSLSQERETYSKTVQDTFDGLAAIKTTGTEGFFARRHGRRNQTAETLAYRIDRDLAFAGWFSGLCSSAAYIATLVLGGWLAMQGRMTAGLIVSLSQLIGGVVAPLEQVPALLTALPGVLLLNVSHKISEAAAGRYDEVLRLENGRLVESGPPPAGNRRQGAR